MTSITLATIISCSQAISIFSRLTSIVGLTPQQKMEIVHEIKKVVPTCPIIIKKDEPTKK